MKSDSIKRIPLTLLAVVVGMLLGVLPIVAVTFFTASVFYPLFAVPPLLMYLFNRLFKGGSKTASFIIIALFTLLSVFLNIMACQFTVYLMYMLELYGLPITDAILLVQLVFESLNILDILQTMMPLIISAYVYSLIFAAMGAAIDFVLLRYVKGTSNGKIDENADNDENVDNINAEFEPDIESDDADSDNNSSDDDKMI